MKALLQSAAVFALLCLGVSTVILAHDAHRLVLDTDKTVRDVDAVLQVQGVNLAAEEAHLDSVLAHVDATVAQLDAASVEQRAYWQKTSADSDKTVKALRLTVDRASLLLDHTDKQLNGQILPDLDRQMNLTAQSAQVAMGSIGHASDQIAFSVSDLPPIFENLREGTAELTSASAHADKILASGERTAAYYEKKLTTPASFAERTAKTLLDVGSKLGNIMAGFVK